MLLLTMIGSSSLSAQPALPLLKDSFRQKAAAAVTAGAYPSLVIAMVAGDRQEILPLGTVTDGQKREPDADTVYEIGSVTKTFTALLLADAVERHEVSLEQPVQRLLPGYIIALEWRGPGLLSASLSTKPPRDDPGRARARAPHR